MFPEQVPPGSSHLRGLPGLMPIIGVWTWACPQASGPRGKMEVPQDLAAAKTASTPAPCRPSLRTLTFPGPPMVRV